MTLKYRKNFEKTSSKIKVTKGLSTTTLKYFILNRIKLLIQDRISMVMWHAVKRDHSDKKRSAF